jgi:hypothetical protein
VGDSGSWGFVRGRWFSGSCVLMTWWRNEPLPRGAGLEKEAETLGVTLHETMKGGVQGRSILDEPELQRRVLAARADRRAARTVIVSVVSAVVSILGAIASWIAVLK